MDTLTPAARSAQMRLIKSRDTMPEVRLRKLIWSLGYRYRKNRRDIAGAPDMSFIGRKKAIFLHGCFWHRHDCTSGQRSPKSRASFWTEKFSRNVERDKAVAEKLTVLGWHWLIVWECEMKDLGDVEKRVRMFLNA